MLQNPQQLPLLYHSLDTFVEPGKFHVQIGPPHAYPNIYLPLLDTNLVVPLRHDGGDVIISEWVVQLVVSSYPLKVFSRRGIYVFEAEIVLTPCTAVSQCHARRQVE